MHKKQYYYINYSLTTGLLSKYEYQDWHCRLRYWDITFDLFLFQDKDAGNI